MNLFTELKRRNVFRALAAYLVIGWLLTQVSTALEEALHLPPWFDSFIVSMLLIGFPLVMFFSWAYEITPEGVKKESDIESNKSIVAHTGKKLDIVTLLAVVAAGGMFAYQQLNPVSGLGSQSSNVSETAEIEVDEKGAASSSAESDNGDASIAVLPFVNMSSDKEQEYFADGISEEILNVLVGIPNLKVAGRTSSFSFKGKNEDLRNIGDALGVNHLLEGSVRRSGTTLRITAQLIRSEDGFHLWSDTYDRELEDIFDIQDEISQHVAEQLAITLGLNTKIKMHQRTDDLLVYENYLKAKQLFLLRGKDNLDQALALLDEATKRDPNFAPAWTYKAYVYGVYGAYSSEEDNLAHSKTWTKEGQQAAQRALQLDTESGDALAATGVFDFYNFKLVEAFESFDRALELEPDNANVLDTVVQHLLATGYYEQSERLSEKSVAIDPLLATYRNIQAATYGFLGEDHQAITAFKKSIELDPSLFFPYVNLLLFYSGKPEYHASIKPLINKALENKAFVGKSATNAKQLLGILNDEDLLADKKALRELAMQSQNRMLIEVISQFTADVELIVNKYFASLWSGNYNYGPDVFTFPSIDGFYKNKLFKEQVKKDGLLALWQARGFPAHCRPIGDDDFECKHLN
jgi:TolB-like protein/Tfp pilus assembly protein PilF